MLPAKKLPGPCLTAWGRGDSSNKESTSLDEKAREEDTLRPERIQRWKQYLQKMKWLKGQNIVLLL